MQGRKNIETEISFDSVGRLLGLYTEALEVSDSLAEEVWQKVVSESNRRDEAKLAALRSEISQLNDEKTVTEGN